MRVGLRDVEHAALVLPQLQVLPFAAMLPAELV
jgi:hypothetical protein